MNLLDLTNESTTLEFHHLIEVQQQINATLRPILARPFRYDMTHDIKAMNSIVNTIMFFRYAYPDCQIEHPADHVDRFHQIDLYVHIPQSQQEPKSTLYINVKSTRGTSVSLYPITNKDDINELLRIPADRNDMHQAIWFFNTKKRVSDVLFFMTSPNSLGNLDSLEDQAKEKREEINILRQTNVPDQHVAVDAYQDSHQLSPDTSLYDKAKRLGIFEKHHLGSPESNSLLQQYLHEALETDSLEEIISFAISLIEQDPAIQAETWTRTQKGVPVVSERFKWKYVEPALTAYRKKKKNASQKSSAS